MNTGILAGRRELADTEQRLLAGSVDEQVFKITGIVSFPSFHAASAVLYIWALWPVRYVGGAAVILNLLMMASTPQ